MDWPNLLVGSVIGFIMGVLANAAFALYYERKAKSELKKKFQDVEGEYTAYGFQKENGEAINYDDPRARCQITYSKDNILLLRHQELNHDHVWEATIWMESPFAGSLAWRYVRLFGKEPPVEHRYGFKRCILSKGTGRKGESRWFLYLEGEPPYGKEALEKSKPSPDLPTTRDNSSADQR